MDISLKVCTDTKGEKYLKISAVIYSADDAATLINLIKTNANSTYDDQVFFPGDPGYEDEE